MTPWCIAWVRRPLPRAPFELELVWCKAADQQRSPDGEAWSLDTACGYAVVLPCGVDRREPTCPDCLAIRATRGPAAANAGRTRDRARARPRGRSRSAQR